MAVIKVEFDSKLKKPEIIIPLTNSSREESGNDYRNNWQQVQQTSIYGIETPLIMINKIVVDFTDVISFNLRSIGPIPQLDMEVKDRDKLSTSIDTPGLDNQICVQIIPQFDNAYKKINLVFSISNISIRNGNIKLSGVYKVPKLLSSSFKSFGEITTYNLFKEIATDSELGFASNCQNNEADKRYIYCDNLSYSEVMAREIDRSESNATQVYDYWIDFWDNINYVNIYDRYNSKDPESEMMVWISGQQNEFEEGIKITPMKVKAVINNNPAFANAELGTNEYTIVNKGYNASGTDRLYSIYENEKGEYMDYLVQDGDVKNDIYTKFEYLGELFGEYNYLLSAACRKTYIQKMNTETIKVILNRPTLSLMRGHNVEFAWYINDDKWKNKVQELSDANVIDNYDNIKTKDDMSAPDVENANTANGEFVLDKSISGQYTIIGCNMNYMNGIWRYELTLARPHANKPSILHGDKK